MIAPHHRPVPELFVSPEATRALQEDAVRLPSWRMDTGQEGELALLLSGGCAPLRGYMTQAQHGSILAGEILPWPVPLSLMVDDGFGKSAVPGGDIVLVNGKGAALAVMSVTDRWVQGGVLLGGRVKGLHRSGHPGPNALRDLWRRRNAARVLAVQPGQGTGIGAAVDLARRMEAELLIQPLPGLCPDMPQDAAVAPLPMAPPDGARGLLWQQAVARNFGATHLLHDDGELCDLSGPDRGLGGWP